ncbi:MAG: Lon protease family protein [Planctomycetota bacterium]|jgi:ATP-dependent Lon protease
MTEAEREGAGLGRGAGRAAGPPPLAPGNLRWRCEAESLPFTTTDDVEPAPGVIGQDAAIDALRFGLETRAAGQNVFVRGLMGTGRMTLVRRVLEELKPTRPTTRDRCYVHNFAQPDRPRLVSLPQGQTRRFRRLVDEMADFIRDDLRRALSAERIRARKAEIDQHAEDQVTAVVAPFERALSEAGLALVTLPTGTVGHAVIFPVVDEKPVTPQEFEMLHEQGKVSDEQLDHFRQQREAFEKELAEIHRQVHDIRRRHAETVGPLLEGEARSILAEFVARIIAEFPEPEVKAFLSEIIDDVVEERLAALGSEEQDDFTGIYRVNALLQQPDGDACPIIIENTPTMTNLLGAVDREAGPMGMFRSNHMMIRAGSLLRADGGYLILEARDVLTEPGAWKVLVRTLRSGRLEIVPPEMSYPWLSPSLKPEPIDVNVKVVLLGDAGLYYLLDSMDEDFPNLFKVLADFDTVIPRDDEGVGHYASVLSRIAQDENLPPLDRSAVAALVEHGARIAAKGSKLTARFGRVADIAREGAFIAGKNGSSCVTGDDVRDAIRRTKRRADLPSRRFRELLADGTICVQTSGTAVGQINGLAVLQAGPLTFGFPARITATIGPGTAGVINIEREAALSGAIHTKGFYILGGLLRHLLQTDHPLAFVASIAFEQSYGGIDGDSASGAEICCLLSALTEIPIRQSLAMTGAIDQLGHLLAIGAVNEKIEGFFDTCCDAGTVDGAGVIIPRANADDLMLRHDVVDACSEGKFHVYAVETVHEAIELLTGRPAGIRDAQGNYTEGSVLALAVTRAHEYWLKAAAPRPGSPPQEQENNESESGGGTRPA